MSLPKLIVIVGPTASGKSSLAIKLGQRFSGEIISADSRQVYRGLDIGSGKVTKEEQRLVPHHLLDVAEPMQNFSAAEFQKRAFQTIDEILQRKHLPFLVGGTALYVYSVIDNYQFPQVAPNPELRESLAKKSISELQVILNNLLNNRNLERRYTEVERYSYIPRQARDDETATRLLNHSDSQNPRRLIRAIEKLDAGASLIPKKGEKLYHVLLLGIHLPRTELYQRIDTRVDERLEQGMIEEVIQLRQAGVSDEWLISLGLEYRFITRYLRGEYATVGAMSEQLKKSIHAFSRRQQTWFKKDTRIHWVKNHHEASELLIEFRN